MVARELARSYSHGYYFPTQERPKFYPDGLGVGNGHQYRPGDENKAGIFCYVYVHMGEVSMNVAFVTPLATLIIIPYLTIFDTPHIGW